MTFTVQKSHLDLLNILVRQLALRTSYKIIPATIFSNLIMAKDSTTIFFCKSLDKGEYLWHYASMTGKTKGSIGHFLRRNLQCRIGTHWRVTNHDDDGWLGDWTCDDCGFHHPAINWPAPPPRPDYPTAGVWADQRRRVRDKLAKAALKRLEAAADKTAVVLFCVKDPDGNLNHTSVSLDKHGAIGEHVGQEEVVRQIVNQGRKLRNEPPLPAPTWAEMETKGYRVVECELREISR